MSILKFITETPRTLQQMHDYMIAPDKTIPEASFGIGVNPRFAVKEMEWVQQAYNYNNLFHPYKQIVFSFDSNVEMPLCMFILISKEIGYVLSPDIRQIFGVVHFKNTANIHCHYMMNYVGIEGNLYRQEFSVYRYIMAVNSVLFKYRLQPIKIEFSGSQ